MVVMVAVFISYICNNWNGYRTWNKVCHLL